jgi:hypothetical protein
MESPQVAGNKKEEGLLPGTGFYMPEQEVAQVYDY